MSTTTIAIAQSKGKPLPWLYFTQFLSAFADNALLFGILALLKAQAYPDYYIGIVQTCFLLAYVILAPFVGTFADKHSKPAVLMAGNLLKAAGVIGLLCGLHPAASYAMAGVGAAVYSPAKYSILKFLTRDEQELLKANSRIEAYTILAILAGSVGGGVLSTLSVTGAVVTCLVLYLSSFAMTWFIPKTQGNPDLKYGNDALLFFKDTAALFRNAKTRFTLVGTGSFWMASSVVRLAVIAWVPVHLGIESMDMISLIVALTAVGIVIGSFLTPKIVPAKKYFTSYRFGLLMVVIMILLPLVYSLPLTIILLLIIGACGGIYLIPLNSALQENKIVGPGKTIAIQNLVENVLMLAGVSAYTKISEAGVNNDTSIVVTAIILLLFVGYLILEKKKLSVK
ncbi:lysophospholipid transporter LplT [Paenibacillus allorhizosphaerae]|uniref:Lysophospholipid transporter LplT n=1 Tax=Paenibacillus allorhizosphaerae TaxID=2849866 RepID=A0ABM8VRD2_9BACL|nr:lysophospholipid transporter LplT [Paenibacillus allorhizosphaerae]CAG7654960.1 Lysophospholipid transporter LplT [Paenibacillus allorhizosphaerae]